MRKKPLSEDGMTDAAYQMHREMLAKEMRGPGDLEPAMYRLQAKFGLDYWRQWQVRYRRSACADFIEQLRQAYLETLARSVRRDVEALKIEELKGAADADLRGLVAEAETILAKIQARKVKA